VYKARLASLSVLVPLSIALGAGACGSCGPFTPSAQNSLKVEDLLKEVHIALNAAAPSLEQLHVPLRTVTLNLQTVATNKGGGSLDLWVVSLGQSIECEATQELSLTLVPAPLAKGYREKASFGEQLAKAIVSAAQSVQGDHDPQSPLKLHQLNASVTFGVAEETKGSGRFKVVPVAAGVEGSMKRKAVQKITLVFEEK